MYIEMTVNPVLQAMYIKAIFCSVTFFLEPVSENVYAINLSYKTYKIDNAISLHCCVELCPIK